MSTLEATNQSPAANPGSNVSTYIGAGIFCFLLAFAVFIIAQPEERTGPPEDKSAQAALPQGHPETSGAPARQQLELQINQLSQALENNPEDHRTRLALANALYDIERFDEALIHYGIFLESNPDDPGARTDMAYGLYKTGNLDGAIAELNRVRAQHPRHQPSAFNLGLMYKEKDQPDSVLAYMAITASIDSTSRAGKAALQVLQAYHQAH